jgi:membrane protein DedA with SNARE-associated domain
MQYAVAHITGLSLASIMQLLSLVALPFAYEDLAIVLGAYIVVNGEMPAGLVVAGLYSGIVVSDFALYGVGAGARRLPWLQRHAVDDRVRGFRRALMRNLFALVALCRFVPGLVFVAAIACGWGRVSLARFTVATLCVSGLYLALMLYLVIVFGDALDDHIGLWAWPFLFAALGVAAFARRRILAFHGGATATEEASGAPPLSGAGLTALPPLAGLARRVGWAERIPRVLFYVPLALHWIALGLRHRSLTLPSAANPGFPTAGLWGESKSEYLRAVAAQQRAAIADFVVMRRRADPSTLNVDHARALCLLADANLKFPVVAKPDIGRRGFGVRLLGDSAALRDYLATFPNGAKLMLQRYVPFAGEADVLYARIPGARRRILSLSLRYFPHVVGDGTSTLRQLIGRDPRARWCAGVHLGLDPSHLGCDRAALDRVPTCGEVVRLALIGSRRAGALHRDAGDAITPALEEKLTAIAESMPEFHYGRFDVRFESMDKLRRGEDLAILQINGIASEAGDAFDPTLSVRETYRRLFAQQRILFAIGACNRARGFESVQIGEFLGRFVQQADLIYRYPASS